MNTHVDKSQEKNRQSAASTNAHNNGGQEPASPFVDNRPEAIAQRKLQAIANNSSQVKQAAQLQSIADRHMADHQAPIQRKVGFEFETSVDIKANGAGIVAKRAKLYEGNNWYITPDSGKIEFVTEPFEEEGEAPETDQLIAALAEMTGFVGNLNQAAADEEGRVMLGAVGPGTANLHEENPIYVPGDRRVDPMIARPQVTGGVSLEKIPDLMKISATRQLPLRSRVHNPTSDSMEKRKWKERTPIGGDDFKENKKNIESAIKAATAYIDGLEDVDQAITQPQLEKLKGFLTLIYHYLYSAARMASNVNQAKYPFSFMSRMSFTAMYSSLTGPVKQLFDSARILDVAGFEEDAGMYSRPLVGNSDDLRSKISSYISTAAFDPLIDSPMMWKGIYRGIADWLAIKNKEPSDLFDVATGGEKEELVTYLVNKPLPFNKNEPGPSRKEWLDSIPPPPPNEELLADMALLGMEPPAHADLLSKSSGSRVVDGMSYSSPAMGEHNALDQGADGTPNELAQIELRSLPQSVPHTEWRRLALNLFKMFRSVQS